MENREIIFVVIFFAYWVFTLIGKKLMQKQNPEEKKGFTLRVLEFITSVAESHGVGKEASDNERSQVGSQVPVEPQPVPLAVKMEEFITPTAVKPSASKQRLKFASTPFMKQPHEKISVLPTSPLISIKKKGYGRKFPKQKLRDAIIWSEILGPPVALRDN